MDRTPTTTDRTAKPAVFVDPSGRRRTAMHVLAALAVTMLVTLLGSTVAAIASDDGSPSQPPQPQAILTPLPGGRA